MRTLDWLSPAHLPIYSLPFRTCLCRKTDQLNCASGGCDPENKHGEAAGATAGTYHSLGTLILCAEGCSLHSLLPSAQVLPLVGGHLATYRAVNACENIPQCQMGSWCTYTLTSLPLGRKLRMFSAVSQKSQVGQSLRNHWPDDAPSSLSTPYWCLQESRPQVHLHSSSLLVVVVLIAQSVS